MGGRMSNTTAEQVRQATLLMAKSVNMDMYGIEEGRQIFRRYIRNNIFGKIVQHRLIEITRKQLENPTIKTRETRTGIYKWLRRLK